MAVQVVGISKTIASKIAFEASMQRAIQNQKYWDELLEKLRKSGGGGGPSSSRFDRIAVSMMLTNFLSNKNVQAILRNIRNEFINLNKEISSQLKNPSQNVFTRIAKIITLIGGRDVPLERLYNVSQNLFKSIGKIIKQIPAIIFLIAFQLNKLKEILEKELREMIKKFEEICVTLGYIFSFLLPMVTSNKNK